MSVALDALDTRLSSLVNSPLLLTDPPFPPPPMTTDIDGRWPSTLLLLDPRLRRGGGMGGGLIMPKLCLFVEDELRAGGGGGLVVSDFGMVGALCPESSPSSAVGARSLEDRRSSESRCFRPTDAGEAGAPAFELEMGGVLAASESSLVGWSPIL